MIELPPRRRGQSQSLSSSGDPSGRILVICAAIPYLGWSRSWDPKHFSYQFISGICLYAEGLQIWSSTKVCDCTFLTRKKNARIDLTVDTSRRIQFAIR